jgi:glutathione S-transferase
MPRARGAPIRIDPWAQKRNNHAKIPVMLMLTEAGQIASHVAKKRGRRALPAEHPTLPYPKARATAFRCCGFDLF